MNSKIKTYRWIVWGTLIMLYLVAFFQRLSVGAIAGDLQSTFGMSAAQIANLGAMYFYAYTIMQIPAGIMADKLGPRLTVVSGTILAGIASMAFSYSTSIEMAYASRLFVGVGVSVVFLSLLKIIGNWFPADSFASMSGLTMFMGNMGGLLAQAPLVIVVGLIGWRSSFFAMGVVTIILSAAVFIIVKNSPADIGLPEVNPQPEKAAGESGNILVQLLYIIKNPRIWCPSIAYAGLHGCFILFSGTFGITYLGYAYGLDKIAASNIVSIVIIAAAVASVSMGFITDSLKLRKPPMIVLSAMSIIAWGILIFVKLQMWYIYIFAALVGMGVSISVMGLSMGKELSNPQYSGMAMSIVNVTGFLFAALMPVICGRIIDISVAAGSAQAVAYQRGFIVCLAASLLSLLMSMMSKETKCSNIYGK
ncbi:MAG: MFS transporter [Clostridiaceae bacterium]